MGSERGVDRWKSPSPQNICSRVLQKRLPNWMKNIRRLGNLSRLKRLDRGGMGERRDRRKGDEVSFGGGSATGKVPTPIHSAGQR